MVEQPLIEMQRRLKAGREYLAALKKLGFNPNAVLWATAGENRDEGRLELLVVTTWADNIGPKAVYDLLFEAYDASATPKEIDPFIVTLLSPQSIVANDLRNAVHTMRNVSDENRPMLVLGMFEYATIPEWIISYRNARSNHFDDVRKFSAFQSKVTKLAA